MADAKNLKKVVVTGADGFIGKNISVALKRIENVRVHPVTIQDDQSVLEECLLSANVVYHLAGVNRPKVVKEFEVGNTNLTRFVTKVLREAGNRAKLIFPSSTQARLDNPYGLSKKAAEEIVLDYHYATGSPVAIYRLPGVFGKWSQPNYNTVVATFCYNISRGLDITITDSNHEIELVYIDDVVAEFLMHLQSHGDVARQRYTVSRNFKVTLGELADRIRMLHDTRDSLFIPDLSDELTKCLHATYLSFLPEDKFSYSAQLLMDHRGWLFELLKSEYFGQIFVSRTLPGITRGNHYHDSKVEKFCVIQGRGVIRFRHLLSNKILEYEVDDHQIKTVDIPPGYTHSIENVGENEMICLFWANQVFDQESPDTFWERVIS